MCRARNTAVIVFLLIPWRKWLGKIVNDTTTNDSATFDIYLHGAWKRKKTFKSGNHSLEEYAQWRLRLKGCAQIVTYAVVGQKTWEGSVCVSVCRFYWVYFESLTWCSGKCYLFINLKTFYIKTNELVLFFVAMATPVSSLECDLASSQLLYCPTLLHESAVFNIKTL